MIDSILSKNTRQQSLSRATRHHLAYGLVTSLTAFGGQFAHGDGWDIGDETHKLHIGGAVRANYIYDDFSNPNTSKLKLDTVYLNLNYNSPKVTGNFQYRCYEFYGKVCDSNFIYNAWLGYKFTPEQQVQVGIQPIPFGIGQWWGSTFYEGLGFMTGLEDVHNPGIKYSYNDGVNEAQIGYFPQDSGNYTGHSLDSRRYTINPARSDPYDKDGTNTHEKDQFVGRIARNFTPTTDVSMQLGASVLHSTIENQTTRQDGARNAWAIFANNKWQCWNLQLQAARQDISTGQAANPGIITFGGFDGSFNLATKGNIYTGELNYTVDGKWGGISNIKPYFNYSTFQKSNRAFKDSTRIIAGVGFNYQKITILAEAQAAKHDAYFGEQEGLATGDGPDQWNKRVLVNIAYYF